MEPTEAYASFKNFIDARREAKELALSLRTVTAVRRETYAWVVLGPPKTQSACQQAIGNKIPELEQSSEESYEYNAPGATYGLSAYDWDEPGSDSLNENYDGDSDFSADDYWTDWENGPIIR